MFSKLFFIVTFLLFSGNPPEKKRTYYKEFYETGKIKKEGWLENGEKCDYWKFYHPTGKISEKGDYKTNLRKGYWYFFDEKGKITQEGHYENGNKTDWWSFYDANEKVNHKCQLSQGKKNGYCLKYMNEKLKSAVKYEDGKKVKEWYSFSSFKKENKLSDLK